MRTTSWARAPSCSSSMCAAPIWSESAIPTTGSSGKPYLDGYRAIFISDTAARVAALKGERVHIEFRGLAPKQRDEIVKALGSKVTVQESPWDCILLVAINHEKKPFDDKRVRRALTLALDRYEGSRVLSQIAIVKEVAGVQVPGTPFATPPEELATLAGYGQRCRGVPAGGAPPAEGGRGGGAVLYLQEPRHPHAL